MNILEDFARHIEFLGFGTLSTRETAGDIFWGWMPDAPNEAVVVYSTDSSYAGSSTAARIQVITRALSPKAAYERSQAIVEALAEFDGYLGGDGARASIAVINASVGLGADTKKRALYSSNFYVHYCDT